MADPKITRGTAEDARTQQDFHRKLPETVERNPKISPATATNLPPERQAQSVVPRIEHTATEATAIDRSVRIEPGAARVALGLKAAGTAALAHDALTAGQDTRNLLDQNNLTGAQSQVMHFAGRNLGMVAGAMAVGSAAAAAGIETGPGAVAAGLAGGVLGAVAGNKIMDAVDQSRIYNQRGSDGNLWNLDPKQPEQGWTRLPRPGEFGPQGPPEGAGYKNHLMYAAPRLADELNYKASNVAVELALAYAPVPKNPFSQPAGPGDAPAADATLWTRDPATRQWSRYVADPTMAAVGVPTGSTEQASPQRSAQLDQAAQAVMASNIAHSAQAIAQRYQADYNSYGWSQHGPVPMAVTTAIQAPPSQQRASDGHQYTQGANGQWTTPGTLYGINTAQGHVRDELNATRQQVQAPPAAPVARQESRTSPAPLAAGRMRFAEAHKRCDEPEQISAGSLQPVGKLDASHLAKGSPLYRMHQAQEQDLMRGLGIAQAQDWERFRNEPSLQQRPSVERTQDRTHRHLLEEVPVQKQPAPPVPAAQTPPPTRGEHAMAPSAAADIAAAQAQVAAAQAELAEMRQQMARMAGQRGQGGLERRDGNDPKEATQPPAATSRPELRIDHPGHPGHELFLQAREHMRALDARMGRSSDQRTDNMAACLAVQACRSGLERIDGVDIGTSGKDVWMAQGPLGTVWMKVAGVPVESADVPVQQTSQGWEQAQQFAQQQQADKHQEQQEHQRVQQQGNDQGPTR